MAEIKIDTGRKEIAIRRDGEIVGNIYFSPADPALLARLNEVREKLAQLDLSRLSTAAENESENAFFEELSALDCTVRGYMDYAFGYPVSDIVFGNGYAYSTCGGTSYAEQLIEGAVDIIRVELGKEQAAAEKRRAKYLRKK